MDYLDRAAQWNVITGECVDPANIFYQEPKADRPRSQVASAPGAMGGNGISSSELLTVVAMVGMFAGVCWKIYQVRNTPHRLDKP